MQKVTGTVIYTCGCTREDTWQTSDTSPNPPRVFESPLRCYDCQTWED